MVEDIKLWELGLKPRLILNIFIGMNKRKRNHLSRCKGKRGVGKVIQGLRLVCFGVSEACSGSCRLVFPSALEWKSYI